VAFVVSVSTLIVLTFFLKVAFAGPDPAFVKNFKPFTAIPGSYFDQRYVEWVWTELNTLEKINREHDKVVSAFDKVRDQLKKMTDTETMAFIAGHPDEDLLKKAHDIEKLYKFWRRKVWSVPRYSWPAFEPNCMEGQLVLLGRRVSDALMDDEWKRKNTITGKCDWPDWRNKGMKAEHNKWRLENARRVVKNFPPGAYEAFKNQEQAVLKELKKLKEMKRSQ